MFHESTLYDQDTFYGQFTRDLLGCRSEVIIECPFITERRIRMLLPILARLRRRGVRIIVNTRNPEDHDGNYYFQAVEAVAAMQDLGVKVLYTVGHHRKLAILDQKIVYEGSLNILSFSDSCEIMRRIPSEIAAKELLRFTAIDGYARNK